MKLLKINKNWIVYVILAFIVGFSYKVRTSNLGNLIDSTTQKYIPLALDPHVFLRYARELLENGSFAAVDMMRYFPNGYTQTGEFSLLTYFIVYLYKFLHLFNAEVTLEYAHVIYPPLVFSITLIFFFLLVRKLFDYRVALLSTAYFAVIPIFLYRTIAGFSDKESFAVMLFILIFYFYVTALLNKTRFKSILFGILAGLTTGLMGLVWGGVQFVFIILALFALIEILLGKFTENDFYTYTSWYILSFIFLTSFSVRHTALSFLRSSSAIALFVLFFGLFDYLLRKYNFFDLKTKLRDKMPLSLFSFIIVSVSGFLFSIVVFGFGFIPTIIRGQIEFLIKPFESRWGITVAESHQPYIRDVVGQLGPLYFYLFLIGSILLFYHMVKNINKHKFKLTIFYSLVILSFLFSRYSPDSMLNGDNKLSLFLYLGSMSIFFLGLLLFYIYTYRKDKESYQHLLAMNKLYILVFVWFIIKIIAARTMVRLIMLLAPITVILVAYLFVTAFDYAMENKNKIYRYLIIILILVFIFNPSANGTLTKYYQSTTGSAKYTGPSYNHQWQQSMAWVRENTPEDAVFVHWWDYGYWVQTGGERATVSDGGNSGGSGLNYFTSRNIITSPSETEALAFMKAKGATYFLTLSDDIGKYPAYSSIGSDLKNDRYSWINTFYLDPSRTEERRNNTVNVYTGGGVLDEDFIYQDQIFPDRAAGIAGFLVPFTNLDNSEITFLRPTAVVVYNNQQVNVPLDCLVFNGKRYVFGNDGLPGCLLIIPRIQSNQLTANGAALYLSKKVKDSLFARLYLYGEDLEHFELVYSDDDQMPLAIYNGGIIGPLKIWKADIPEDLEVDEILKGTDLPDPALAKVV